MSRDLRLRVRSLLFLAQGAFEQEVVAAESPVDTDLLICFLVHRINCKSTAYQHNRASRGLFQATRVHTMVSEKTETFKSSPGMVVSSLGRADRVHMEILHFMYRNGETSNALWNKS